MKNIELDTEEKENSNQRCNILNAKELIEEAISLPVEGRAVVADSKLKSLNKPDNDIDRKWASVAKRRLEELRSGEVEAVPGDEVFARVWERFSK